MKNLYECRHGREMSFQQVPAQKSRGSIRMEFCELGRERFLQYGERFLQQFKESWRLRAAVFFTLAACAVMALFVLSSRADGQEQVVLSAGSMERAGEGAGKQGAVLPIRGSGRALDRENLRNPFLAGHPSEEQQKARQAAAGQKASGSQVAGQGRLPAGGANTGNVPGKGQAAAGQVQAAASAGQAAGKAGAGADRKANDSGLQLQGIIHAGDGVGALVLAGGRSRLLLAGEMSSGMCLEGVEQDEAVIAVNGCRHRLRIGDRLA
ncbi:MAG: hypothetical protein ACI3U2_09500 [Anaerovibrio sp.]